ncbi:MAG: M23 family metallopeptidase [Alistipes sp.]|nr:M23 family metallopeptidase [Alistipes sp.]
MKRLCWIAISLIFSLISADMWAQALSDEEYVYPMPDVRRLYSANFGEMRPDHFHSGIDIKTDGVEGKSVVAIADGYISRIVDKPSGYGRALYVVHPEKGTTSVYAHLSHFRHDIDSMIMAERYRLQRNSMDIPCAEGRYPVRQGEIIGYSGNSGNSFGPHLHFEIRQTATQRTLNLVTERIFKIKDTTPPTINGLYFVATDTVAGAPRHAKPQHITLKRTAEGRYTSLATRPVRLGGESGYFVLDLTDRKDGVWNRFGVWRVAAEVDNQPIFDYRMDGYTFDMTRYCNAVAYYPMQLRARSEVIRLARIDGNRSEFYTTLLNDGAVALSDSVAHSVRIVAEDDCHNRSIVELKITGGGALQMPSLADTVVIDRKRPFAIEQNDIKLSVPKESLYESTHFHCGVVNRALPQDSTLIVLSPVYKVLDNSIPLHRSATLTLKGYIPLDLRPHTAIATLSSKGKTAYVGGSCQDGEVTARISRFGEFWVVADTVAPAIRPRFEQGADMRGRTRLIFEVEDNFSGLKEYNAYINGEWVPLEYSPTRHTLTYHFDSLHPLGGGEHLIVLIVEDNCGNRASIKRHFRR